MPKWISLSEAAYRYGVGEEDIRFWIRVREIAFVHVGTTYVVDDKSIQRLLSRHQTIPTEVYIDAMEQYYQNEIIISESYVEILSLKEQELQFQKDKISRMQQLLQLHEENNKRIKAMLVESQNTQAKWQNNWFTKIWKALKPTTTNNPPNE